MKLALQLNNYIWHGGAPQLGATLRTIAQAADEWGEGIAERICGQALARLGNRQKAETHLAASVRTLLAGECRLEAARTHVVWGLLCRDHGDDASAQTHFEQAGAQFEDSGLTHEREIVQAYLADVVEC